MDEEEKTKMTGMDNWNGNTYKTTKFTEKVSSSATCLKGFPNKRAFFQKVRKT